MTSELETNLVAVERIEEYCQTPTEVNFIKVQTAANNLVPRLSPLTSQEERVLRREEERFWKWSYESRLIFVLL